MSAHSQEPLIIPSPKPVKGQRACDGCGSYHGSVNAETLCLRAHLTRERERVSVLTAIIDEMRRPAREYYGMRRAKPVAP